MRYLLFPLLAFAFILPTRAADKPAEPEYKKMPWHLIDLWWDLGKDRPFESYSIDVTLDRDVPADVNLYVAPIGIARLGDNKFYGGLQTRSDGNTRTEPKLRSIGPGLLLSMWGERSLDAIRPSDGGFLQSSGHEGDFVSVRRPYAWTKGTYTYRVAKMEREIVDGKPCTWVGAFLHNHAKDETIFIGALRFPSENLVLNRQVASFVEVYGQQKPVADIPKVTVTFGSLKVNGEAIAEPPVRAVYPKGVPDYADAKLGEAGVVIAVGRPVEGRTQRQATLRETPKP